MFLKISPSEKSLIKKERQPDHINPMLATLTHDYFSNEDWIFEEKFDGVRCIAIKKDGKVQLLSRNHHNMNAQYPEIVQSLLKQKADDFIIDGEIVALNNKGVTDFQLLQSRINRSLGNHQSLHPIYYRIFDLLYVDGYNIQHLPLLTRKKNLKRLLRYNTTLIFTEHLVSEGLHYYKQACKKHWEGIIAKRSDSPYVNRRSRDWLKFKCSASQELVIGGFTEPRGSRPYFGALLVGYYVGKDFSYAGKVGTGFSFETLKFLYEKLSKITTNKCPFYNYNDSPLGVQWVKPQLVANFEFAQWTQAGKLRVGRYKGLRTDKKASKVIRES